MQRLGIRIRRLGVAQALAASLALLLAVWGYIAKPPCRPGFVALDFGRFLIVVQVALTLFALGCLAVSLHRSAQGRSGATIAAVLVVSLGLEVIAIIGWGSTVYADLTNRYSDCFTF